jgi:hypothetical protein
MEKNANIVRRHHIRLRYSRLACNFHAILALLMGARPNEICTLCGCYFERGYLISLDDGVLLLVHQKCAEECFESTGHESQPTQ